MLAGTWLGHTIEYLRVWGPRGAATSMAASAHAYMGPLGAALALAGLLGVLSTARLVRRLERRLRELRPRRSGRPERSTVPAAARGVPSWSFSLAGLVATMWAGQCGLYLLQENLEASAAGRPLPGLAVLSGVHALAPLVHLIVAAAIVAGLWLARRQVTRLADAVHRAEQRLRAAAGVVAGRLCPTPRAWTPLERWGTQRLSRPPPVVAG
jgi:hypothetical protein